MIISNESHTTVTANNSALDATGKTIFDDIYISPDPRSYCAVMQSLDYMIPEHAQPMFDQLFQHYREQNEKESLRVLDIGASYGINSALLSAGLTLPELFQRYTETGVEDLSTQELLSRDCDTFNEQTASSWLDVVGFDISAPALRYAKAAGLIVDAVHADLETNDVTSIQAQKLETVDCIISSGCIGYVTTKTLEKILDACSPKLPWMVHCVLRMFPLQDLVPFLQVRGYKVEVNPTPVPQRRFASEEEKCQVLSRLAELDIDASDYEETGWLYSWVIKATH